MICRSPRRRDLPSVTLTLEILEERSLLSSTPSGVALGVVAGSPNGQANMVASDPSTTGPLSPDQAYVQSLYINLLGRTGTISELNVWVGVMNQPFNGVNTTGQAAVAQDIQYSPESEDRIINNLYLQLLGRPADPQGLATFTNVLNAQFQDAKIYYQGAGLIPLTNGYGTVETIEATILSSSEYLAKTGGNVVVNYFQTLLGRNPTTQELNDNNRVLKHQGAEVVASDLLESVEFREDYLSHLFLILDGVSVTPQSTAFYADQNPDSIEPMLIMEYDVLKSSQYFAHAPATPGVSS